MTLSQFSLADFSLAAFALLNGSRAVAYLPQMARVYRCPHGAAAVSITTWALFAAANLATVLYALAVSHDRVVAAVFALNAAGCLAIVVLTAMKRAQAAALPTHAAHLINPDTLRDDTPLHDGTYTSPSAPVRDAMIRQGCL